MIESIKLYRIYTLTAILLFLLIGNKGIAQQIIPLYAGKIPNSRDTKNKEYENEGHFIFKISIPTLSIYQPPKGTGNGTAIIVCPGGGYTGVNYVIEGSVIAEKLNKLGITAFVLKYRLPDDTTMVNKMIGPLQDAQQAIMEVRSRSKEWQIDSTKVGIMGFSAGGHLASTTGTHFNKSYIDNPIHINLRPDFMILVYPVISFTDSIAHLGSRESLIGKNPTPEIIREYSNEQQVSGKTPPTFLICAGDDGLVSVKNTIAFYNALQKNKVPAGMHIFPTGQHGFFDEPAHSNWFNYCALWLKENHWIN